MSHTVTISKGYRILPHADSPRRGGISLHCVRVHSHVRTVPCRRRSLVIAASPLAVCDHRRLIRLAGPVAGHEACRTYDFTFANVAMIEFRVGTGTEAMAWGRSEAMQWTSALWPSRG